MPLFTSGGLGLGLGLVILVLVLSSGQIVKSKQGVRFPVPSLSPPSPFLFPYPFLPRPLPLPFLSSLPLEVGPLNPARGSGERYKLPQRGLGQSPSRNRIWCTLTLKSDIWWRQF